MNSNSVCKYIWGGSVGYDATRAVELQWGRDFSVAETRQTEKCLVRELAASMGRDPSVAETRARGGSERRDGCFMLVFDTYPVHFTTAVYRM